MLRNFTVIDSLKSVEAAMLFTLVLFVPGFVVGWLTNVFDFRRRRSITKVLFSPSIAISVMPIFVYLLGRYPWFLWSALVASWVAFAFVVLRSRKRISWKTFQALPRHYWIGGTIALIWSMIAVATLVDVQIKDRLYFSVPAYDYSLRSAITASAARSIPPANPFFASDPPVMLRYHHFWMLLCSLVMKMGGVSARQAMYGGTIWAGIILMCLIAVCMKFFIHVRENVERKVLLAWGLLFVTGLDILPTLFIYLRFHAVTPDMEWWNEQITSWMDALLWVPHHILCLVACMVGFLVLREPARTWKQRVVPILFAALSFASAAGLSVLVTFTFALFIALWLPFAALRRWWDDVVGFLAAGAGALLLAYPYIHSLLGPAADQTPGAGRFAIVSVRGFPLGIEIIAEVLGLPPKNLLFLSLPLLPVNYFLELGFFFLIGVLRIRSIRSGFIPMTRDEETGWMMVFTSFLVGSFLRSTTIGSNDLGWRCFMLAQLVLLLWGAVVIEQWWTAPRPAKSGSLMRVARVCLIFGVLGTAYQVVMLRIYPLLHDTGKVDPKVFTWVYEDQVLGERSFALRSVYEQLNANLPATAIVQYNPYAKGFISPEIYSGHNAVVGAPQCAAAFGGDPKVCKTRMESIVPLFANPSREQSAALDDTCRKYSIDVMLVDDTDAVWKQRDSWVWTRTPLLANDHVRAFGCGVLAQQAGLRPPS